MTLLKKILATCFWFLATISAIPALVLSIDGQPKVGVPFFLLTLSFLFLGKKSWPKKNNSNGPSSESQPEMKETHNSNKKQINSNTEDSSYDELSNFKLDTEQTTPDSSQVTSRHTEKDNDLVSINIHNYNSVLGVSTHTQLPPDKTELLSETSNLSHFRIKGLQEKPQSKQTSVSWIQSDESIKVGKYNLKGMLYVGTHLSSLDGYRVESSLINPELPHIDTPFTYQDETLSYWPSFSSISPKCRGAYLSWVASSRNDPTTPLGYVFIYFYGLERRLLIDLPMGSVSENEAKDLKNEVQRLVSLYGENRSFQNYGNNLLDYLDITNTSAPQNNKPLKIGNLKKHTLKFKVRLAKTVQDKEPVSADLALNWTLGFPEYKQKTASKRCPDEFKDLFYLRYAEQFDAGLIVKPNKTKLRASYYPASGSLHGFEPIELNLPDPSILKAPLKKLITLADSCNTELDTYSRYIGQQNNSPKDIEAQLLLPAPLLKTSNNSSLTEIRAWMNQEIIDNSGLIKVAELWEKAGRPHVDKINKKEIEFISKLTQANGFSFAPNPKYHSTKPSADGLLAIISETENIDFTPSPMFLQLTTTLRLGSAVACIDNQIKPHEVEYLNTLIESNTNITLVEKASLRGYLAWLLHSPMQTLGMKAAIAKLSDQHKAAVGSILIEVAISDGSVVPEEIKQLEKLYTALGLEKSQVTSDIHRRSSSPHSYETSHKQSCEQTQSTGFVLDEKRLKELGQETEEISTFIGDIFADEQEEEEATVEQEVEVSTVITSPIEVDEESLSTKLQPIFELLISQETWPRNEVNTLCKKHNLMTDGTIEAINDWSFTLVDAALIEDDGDTIFIDQEIREELLEQELSA